MKVPAGFQYPFPLFVYPTRRCNYACSYCFTESDPSKPPTSFALNHWDSLMEQARDLGVPEIRISGGEPLLIQTLKQLCDTVARLGMRYTVTTNGSLLRRHLKWMVENPPDTIWLSFHAEYATRNQFVAQVAEAAGRLPMVGVNLFDVDLVADPKLVARSVEAGARRIKIVYRTPIGRYAGRGNATIHLPMEMLRSVGAIELRIELPTTLGTPLGPRTCVLATRPLLGVDHDGCVYPCCVTVGSRSDAVGDLSRETLLAVATRVAPQRLPCSSILPAIAKGEAACPLSLAVLSQASGNVADTNEYTKAFGGHGERETATVFADEAKTELGSARVKAAARGEVHTLTRSLDLAARPADQGGTVHGA